MRHKARRTGRQPSPTPAAPSPRRWLQSATLLLTSIGLLCLFATEIADTDFWWRLKTGQYIAQHQAPVPDPFAYTTPAAAAYPGEAQVRHFNLTHEWLSQLWMYAVYSLAGFLASP